MRFKLYLLSIGLLATFLNSNLLASTETDNDWKKQLSTQKLDSKEQSYCYTNPNGEVEGINIDKKIRLASVSKLIISLWSIDQLGLNYKFKTKLFIKGNQLHIKGAIDPYLGAEKMFFLISQLNELGFYKFDSISFDNNFYIDPDPSSAHSDYPVMSPTVISKLLKKYMNTSTWDLSLTNSFKRILAADKLGRFKKDLSFEVEKIEFLESNPFENDSDARELTLSSPELFRYLKQMNIDSNNYVSENLFKVLGKNLKLERFLKNKYGLDSNQIYFYTGSGLPYFKDKTRFDNYATCSIVAKLIGELKTTIESQSKELEDVVAVPGSDTGTFRNRVFPSDYKNAFVAKTGTLMHTSTLAGAMSTTLGLSFFGIFNQTTEIAKAKIVQNSMVSSIMTDLGGPKAFDYTVDIFHTYDENIKSLNINQYHDLVEHFSTIDENLY